MYWYNVDLGPECPIWLALKVIDGGKGPCLDQAHHKSSPRPNQPLSAGKGCTCGSGMYNVGQCSMESIQIMYEDRALQHPVPWMCWYMLRDHPHVGRYVSRGWQVDNGWDCRCPFPAKLRSKVTNHANSESHELCQSLKLHQCIYTHKTSSRNKIIISLYQSITKKSNSFPNYGAHKSVLGHFIRQCGRANHSHRVNFNGTKGGEGLNGKVEGDDLSYLWNIC